MTKSPLVVLTILPLLFLQPATAAEPDRWTEDAGAELAGEVIAECLEEARSDSGARFICIRRPYEVCEGEHGTMNMREMGDCARFSRQAWERVLQSAIERAKEHLTADWLVEFDASQGRWLEWSEQDCVVQNAASEGGSIHSFAVTSCKIRHTGLRAIEIEAFAEELDR